VVWCYGDVVLWCGVVWCVCARTRALVFHVYVVMAATASILKAKLHLHERGLASYSGLRHAVSTQNGRRSDPA
jgi:hypothetical protein